MYIHSRFCPRICCTVQFSGLSVHSVPVLLYIQFLHFAIAVIESHYTVDSGYQAHALVGTIAKIYALHNEVRHIARVKGRPRLVLMTSSRQSYGS